MRYGCALAIGLAAAACLSRIGAAATPDAVAPDYGNAVTPTSTLFPGGGQPPPPDPRGKMYDGNPQAIAEGARLFDWYNCSGCHFHGAGGIGPALMDPQWRYGGRIDQIHETLVQGRPNGMPSWAGKIPDKQLWEISAYVRSLSAASPTTDGGEMPQPPAAPAGPPAPPIISPK
jgi:cytochrome c oxidase cbb3-type subunit 3